MDLDTPLMSLPFHVRARSPSEIIVSRGMVSIQLEGDDVLALLRDICDRLSRSSASRMQVIAAAGVGRQEEAARVLDLLIERRIVVPSVAGHPQLQGLESPLDLFQWQFGSRALAPRPEFADAGVAVVGRNHIGAPLVAALTDAGFTRVAAVDDPFLNRPGTPTDAVDWLDPREFVARMLDATRIVVVCSDGGSVSMLREWNAICVRSGLRVLPVLLQGMVGFVGPLVVPGATACLECKVRRESGGAPLASGPDVLEAEASRASLAAFHPSMAAILAHCATMELVKYLGDLPVATAGVVYDINLLRPEMVSRRVLKIPGCPVCSPVNATPAFSIVDVEKQR